MHPFHAYSVWGVTTKHIRYLLIYYPHITLILPSFSPLTLLRNRLSASVLQVLSTSYPSLAMQISSSSLPETSEQFRTHHSHSPLSNLPHTQFPDIMSDSTPSFLQLQTRAAHPPRRPPKQPDKDLKATVSRTSSTSASSPRSSIESSPSHSPSTDWARCSRCHRSVSVDGSPPSMTGVSIGTNSYYCQRCANLVGYPG